MKLAFLFVGGQKESWLEELSADYEKKIKAYCPTEIIRLKPSKLARAEQKQKLADETETLMRAIKKDDFVILCDERGKIFSSREFSAKLVKGFETGKPRVLVVVGGAFGVSEAIKGRADLTWALSPLVLSHVIAQAVVLEQVYRAFTIWKNIPYHND
jgi:23S rRNA (pseudouridine1915-N3)-methyltransferase